MSSGIYIKRVLHFFKILNCNQSKMTSFTNKIIKRKKCTCYRDAFMYITNFNHLLSPIV